jgi:hypothetical protein
MKRVGDWGPIRRSAAFGGIADPVAVSPKAAAFIDCGRRKATLTGSHRKAEDIGRVPTLAPLPYMPQTGPLYRPRIKHRRPDYGPKLNVLFTLPFAKYFGAAGRLLQIFVARAEKGCS